jgi:hypothetical protein
MVYIGIPRVCFASIVYTSNQHITPSDRGIAHRNVVNFVNEKLRSDTALAALTTLASPT